MKILKKIFVFGIIIIYTAVILADTIYLNDGTIIQGKVLDQSKTKVKIDVNGTINFIEKDSISRIEYDYNEEIEIQRKPDQIQRKNEPPKKFKKNKESIKEQTKENLPPQEENYLRYVAYGVLIWAGLGYIMTNFNIDPKNYKLLNLTSLMFNPSLKKIHHNKTLYITTASIVSITLFTFFDQNFYWYQPYKTNSKYDYYENNVQNLQNNIKFYDDMNDYPIFMFRYSF